MQPIYIGKTVLDRRERYIRHLHRLRQGVSLGTRTSGDINLFNALTEALDIDGEFRVFVKPDFRSDSEARLIEESLIHALTPSVNILGNHSKASIEEKQIAKEFLEQAKKIQSLSPVRTSSISWTSCHGEQKGMLNRDVVLFAPNTPLIEAVLCVSRACRGKKRRLQALLKTVDSKITSFDVKKERTEEEMKRIQELVNERMRIQSELRPFNFSKEVEENDENKLEVDDSKPTTSARAIGKPKTTKSDSKPSKSKSQSAAQNTMNRLCKRPGNEDLTDLSYSTCSKNFLKCIKINFFNWKGSIFCPRYASCAALELHVNENDYTIKLMYWSDSYGPWDITASMTGCDYDLKHAADVFTKLRRAPDYVKVAKENEQTINQLKTVTGLKDFDLWEIYDIYDTLFIEKVNNVSWPDGMTEELYKDTDRLADLVDDIESGLNVSDSEGIHFETEIPKITGGPLLSQLISHMKFKRQCLDKKTDRTKEENKLCAFFDPLKYYVFSAHDTTIEALFSTFGFQETNYNSSGQPKQNCAEKIRIEGRHEAYVF
ncbi:Histidine acid phosphatase domain containing protein [Aphelenchoides besseyi]|nr:Histidine acid phosphatase domain containing protein [Aphelenchoides besseyi]